MSDQIEVRREVVSAALNDAARAAEDELFGKSVPGQDVGVAVFTRDAASVTGRRLTKDLRVTVTITALFEDEPEPKPEPKKGRK